MARLFDENIAVEIREPMMTLFYRLTVILSLLTLVGVAVANYYQTKRLADTIDDPPIVPIDDALTQKLRIAANADYTAGKSDKKILLPLAEIFSAAGGSEPFPPAVITVADLDNLLYQARLFAKLPPPETAYPTLRNTAIREVIYAALGVDANSGAVKLTDAMKVKAKEIFGKIAASLEILSK